MNSYKNPNAEWLGSPDYTPDRAGHDMSQPAWVVLHTMVGTIESANARFQQPNQEASATYGVGLDGRLVQWVDEKDAAWANGTMDGVGSNLDSISIEHEDNGDFNGPRTPALYRASALLVRDICNRYGLPINRDTVKAHREVSKNPTACPDALDVDRIVRMAAGTEPLPAEGPVEPDVILQPFVPTVAGAVVPAGATAYDWNTLDTAGTLPGGFNGNYAEAKQRNNTWYVHLTGSDWCVKDDDFDTGGTNPQQEWDKRHQAPAPVVVAPPPPPPPAPTPTPPPPAPVPTPVPVVPVAPPVVVPVSVPKPSRNSVSLWELLKRFVVWFLE